MGTPRTMRSARWKREANSLIFSHVAVSTGVIDSPETPLYLALDCLRVELGKSLLPNIQPINCNVTNVLSKFREECIDDGGGCGFFLPRRGHYVQDIHVRCPSHLLVVERPHAGIRQHVPICFVQVDRRRSERGDAARLDRASSVKASYFYWASPSHLGRAGRQPPGSVA